MSKKFSFRNGSGNYYEIKDVNGNKIICDAPFSIQYDEHLLVNMDYLGQMPANPRPDSINAQGRERDSNKYFEKILKEHSEWFDDDNVDMSNHNTP